MSVVWESEDPRNHSWGAYSPQHTAMIESAFQNPNKPTIKIMLGTTEFTISVAAMKQINSKGATRDIRRSGPPPAPQQTRPCKYFNSPGGCKSGMSCPYSHIPGGQAVPSVQGLSLDSDDDDLGGSFSAFAGPPKEQTNIKHATPCRFFLAGSCKDQMKCTFPHVTAAEAQMAAAAPGLLYSVIPCMWHKKPGGCNNGAVCPFKHEGPGGAAPLPPPAPPIPNAPVALPPCMTPCKLWAAGNCPHGDFCIYNHSGPGGSLVQPPASIPCKMWALGKCNKGSACKFKHEGPPGGAKPPQPGGGGAAQFQPHDPTGTGRCRSLFVGINYFGTDAELHGCVNDVKTMLKVLNEFHGFNLDDKRILVDDKTFPGRHGPPTKKNILESFKWLVEGAKAGDTLFFHYSGHGCRVPDQDGDEDDGFDEALCPVDHRTSYVILDDEVFDALCRNLPSGVRLTAVMDCCHSGSIMDLEWGYVQKLDKRNNQPIKEWSKCGKKHSNGDIIMFSGCKDSQTSADVSSTAGFHHGATAAGKAGGAATNALAEALWNSGPSPGNVQISYCQLIDKMCQILKSRGFTQIPQLSASKASDLDRLFSITGPIASH